MEDFFHSELPEGEHHFTQTQYESNNGSSFYFPIQPCYGHVSHGEIVEDTDFKNCSKRHSQAEKRRRDRISAYLNTLREMISTSDEKMDKATLLGSVVEHIKDLKRKAYESRHAIIVPSDFDEATIECYIDEELSSINVSENKENIYIKASLCCEDRPELLEELNQSFRGLQMTILRGDMACLGGRIKSILVLCFNGNGEVGSITRAIQSLKGVLRRISSFSSGSIYNIRSKRQRLLFSAYNQ